VAADGGWTGERAAKIRRIIEANIKRGSPDARSQQHCDCFDEGTQGVTGGPPPAHENSTAFVWVLWKGAPPAILRIIVKYRDVVDASILHETSVLYVFQNSLEDEPDKVWSRSVYT
jgi:hypothetical protein